MRPIYIYGLNKTYLLLSLADPSKYHNSVDLIIRNMMQ